MFGDQHIRGISRVSFLVLLVSTVIYQYTPFPLQAQESSLAEEEFHVSATEQFLCLRDALNKGAKIAGDTVDGNLFSDMLATAIEKCEVSLPNDTSSKIDFSSNISLGNWEYLIFDSTNYSKSPGGFTAFDAGDADNECSAGCSEDIEGLKKQLEDIKTQGTNELQKLKDLQKAGEELLKKGAEAEKAVAEAYAAVNKAWQAYWNSKTNKPRDASKAKAYNDAVTELTKLRNALLAVRKEIIDQRFLVVDQDATVKKLTIDMQLVQKLIELCSGT